VWSEIFFILELDAPFTVLIFRNRFGFAIIIETMEFSDEDSADYTEEESNAANDENKNSASHNNVDVSADTYKSTNESKINGRTNGVNRKFHSEPYINLSHYLLTCSCCLSSLLFTLNLIKSICRKLQKEEDRSFLHPLQITMSLEVLCRDSTRSNSCLQAKFMIHTK
jgi:hypothetical protein